MIIALFLLGILAFAFFTSAYTAIPGVNTLTGSFRSLYNRLKCLVPSACTNTTLTSATASYDQQIALLYGQDYSSLNTNVAVVEQSDGDGFGPAYLLNGLSNAGWWYQVGLSWNWPLASGRGYSNGVHFVWEVFAPNGTTTTPTVISFSGPVNRGDNMFLSLAFSGGNVVMYGFDNSTGASATHSYSGVGANMFLGRSSSPNSKFFTGLMTEWYHANSNVTSMKLVSYSGLVGSSAWICIDEFAVANRALVYGQCTATSLIPQSFTYHGLYANDTQYQFNTGPS
jgi:hypothetical protein